MIGCLILLSASSYFGYQTRTLGIEKKTLLSTLASRESTLADANKQIILLTEGLQSMTDERDMLTENLHDEKTRNNEFADTISAITGTVGKLDKLAKTDPELLKKYSKVYFLNEHYVPPKLTLLDKTYGYDETREFYLATAVVPFYTDMVTDAKKDGFDVWIISAYRSFDTQKDLKNQYSVTYGSGANTFSADQGYSEHQLGTTVDLTTTGLQGSGNGFDGTKAYVWMQDNAYKYGFILSYPAGNAYYIFEPWHWRFVGTDLAHHLHKDGKYFYDLDQRILDGYLISIFD
jgi:LAS superfamily LD-carboxypeptidase LdcB